MLNSQKECFDYLPKSRNADSFFFNPVTQTEIESEIMNTPLNKAHGLYSFPTRVLRSARHILSHPLSVLINKSVEHGIYPTKLKFAKVIPIHKGNDESDPSNYLTNRFHVAVHLSSNRSQMTSKCGKNKKVAHEAIAEYVTDVLTTF